MGQLEDMAREKGIRSLRALALKIIPEKSELNQDYIANKVRELDKGKDVAWWTNTGKPYLLKLIDVLNVEESELFKNIQVTSSENLSGVANLWFFEMFPALSPLDLRTEKLFPGLPTELARIGGPQNPHTWWIAPTGAGKSILGRWLEVQFGWTFLKAASWSEVEWPEKGRVFLELESGEGAPLDPAQVLSENLRLCVAAPMPPPQPKPTPDTSRSNRRKPVQETKKSEILWSKVISPPPEQWLTKLIDWVDNRLRKPGGFVSRDVHDLLKDASLAALIQTPGQALDLFGVMDDIGIETSNSDAKPWAKSWLRAATEREDRSIPPGMHAHLRKRGIDVVITATEARLRRGLGEVQSAETWAALMPTQDTPTIDIAKIMEITKRREENALDEIERLLRPDGACWVEGFRAIHLLKADPNGLRLHPQWLALIVMQAAFEKMITDVPDGLGALLLHDDMAELTMNQLFEKLKGGDFAFIQQVITSINPKHPESLICLDGAVRAVGIAVANGIEVPIDLITKLWDHAITQVKQRHPSQPPMPLLMVNSGGVHGWGSVGIWFLSMFLLSWALTHKRNPWSDTLSAQGKDIFHHALSQANSVSRRWNNKNVPILFWVASQQWGYKLIEHVGVIRLHGRILDIQVPHIIIKLAKQTCSQITTSEFDEILQLTSGLDALEEACKLQNTELAVVLAWCWKTWATKTNDHWPPFTWIHGDDPGRNKSKVQILWKSLPADLCNDALFSRIRNIGNDSTIWLVLSHAVWERWLEWWASQQGGFLDDFQAFETIPIDLAIKALRDGSINVSCHEIRTILWHRIPDELLNLIDQMTCEHFLPYPKNQTNWGPLADLVASAPDVHVPLLVERAKLWVTSPERYPGVKEWVQQWLMIVIIDRRKPGWRHAFTLLADRA